MSANRTCFSQNATDAINKSPKHGASSTIATIALKLGNFFWLEQAEIAGGATIVRYQTCTIENAGRMANPPNVIGSRLLLFCD